MKIAIGGPETIRERAPMQRFTSLELKNETMITGIAAGVDVVIRVAGLYRWLSSKEWGRRGASMRQRSK
jgi:hypothetical protein